MWKSFKCLLILLVTNFTLVVLVQGELQICSPTQVNDSSGACIEKEACIGYVTGTSCSTECDDTQYAVTEVQNSKTYNKCVQCDKNHVSSDQMTCQDTCLTEVIQTGKKRCLDQASKCTAQLSKDQTECGENICKSTEIVTDQAGKSYKLCASCDDETKPVPNNQKTACGLCDYPKIADIASHTCLATSADCTGNRFVLSDERRCGAACGANQAVNDNNGYKSCNDCGVKYVSLDKKSCLVTCPLQDLYTVPETPLNGSRILPTQSVKCLTAYTDCKGVVSNDLSMCVNSCSQGYVSQIKSIDGKQYNLCVTCAEKDKTKPLYQLFNNQISCVDTCQGDLIQLEDNTCKSMDSCTQIVSSDNKKCSKTCPTEEYVSDTVNSKNYKTCLKTCPQGKYHYSLQSIQYCTATCPDDMFVKDNQCLSRKECDTVISKDYKTCDIECNSTKREIAVQMSGYKLCVSCNGYFIEKTESTPSQCLSICPKGLVSVVVFKQCVSKDEAPSACGNFLMSSDETFCSSVCIYPDMFHKAKNKCVKTCDENTIADETKDPVTCIPSINCGGKYSSDKTTCIKDCSFVQEEDPLQNTNVCQSCGKLFYYYDKIGLFNSCKASVSNEEQIATLSQYLKADFTNQKSAMSVKDSLSKFVSSSAKTMGSKTNNKLVIDNIELLANQFLYRISPLLAGQDPYSIGSKESVKTVLQNMGNGKKHKLALSVQSLLGDTPPDLTQFKEKSNDSAYQSVVSSVIVNNPACSADNCKYPLVTVNGKIGGGRLLQSADPFTVDFQVTTVSSNYICLSYNLETNVVVDNSQTEPLISNNGLTATCTVNGATSLFLDSTCIYLDKSKCPSNNQNNSSNNNSSSSDDGLSAGGIAGIVIGSIVFAAIVGVGSFFLYRRLHQNKLEKKEGKYIQPPFTTTEA